MLTICIGYDPAESVAFHVLSHSIMRRASAPVAIIPLCTDSLRSAGLYWRQTDATASTDFTYTRFLTPELVGARSGQHAIFMDCDMLCLADIHEVLLHCDPYCDVSVTKHDYTPKPGPKFLGHAQHTYPMKNWSSLMVFNLHRASVQNLTPEFVSTAEPSTLHQFKWCRNAASVIGSLPLTWNHLVDEYPPNPDAKIVHFTRGGPWFPGFTDCEYAEHWRAEYRSMCNPLALPVKYSNKPTFSTTEPHHAQQAPNPQPEAPSQPDATQA